MSYVITFFAGLTIGAVSTWLVFRKNPQVQGFANRVADETEDLIKK